MLLFILIQSRLFNAFTNNVCLILYTVFILYSFRFVFFCLYHSWNQLKCQPPQCVLAEVCLIRRMQFLQFATEIQKGKIKTNFSMQSRKRRHFLWNKHLGFLKAFYYTQMDLVFEISFSFSFQFGHITFCANRNLTESKWNIWLLPSTLLLYIYVYIVDHLS